MIANQFLAYKCLETPLVAMRNPAASPASLAWSAAKSPQVFHLRALDSSEKSYMHGLPSTLIIRILSVVIRLYRLPRNRKGYMLLGAKIENLI